MHSYHQIFKRNFKIRTFCETHKLLPGLNFAKKLQNKFASYEMIILQIFQFIQNVGIFKKYIISIFGLIKTPSSIFLMF